jgi:hypothetical protein
MIYDSILPTLRLRQDLLCSNTVTYNDKDNIEKFAIYCRTKANFKEANLFSFLAKILPKHIKHPNKYNHHQGTMRIYDKVNIKRFG